ncbi:MAG: hypothetical protein KC766_35130 [Myxococcales bacterium]|nr:hypothetical protein [Myxococcales bacterium]
MITPLSPARDPFAHRLQLFTGKGGVGKSTLVAALAIEAARRGMRPLVVELGHRASMEAVFGQGPIGYEPHDLGRGVSAMNLGVEGALADYVADNLRLGGFAKLVLDNKALKRFLYAAPGVAEVVTLSKLKSLVEMRKADGKPCWHPIYVDLDATGHALMLLELPRVLDGLVGAGPLRRLLASVSDLLADSDRVVLNLVTLPTELPVQETLELYENLDREHRIQLGRLYVNQVPSEPLTYQALSVVDDLSEAALRAGDVELGDDIALGRAALRRFGRVRDQLKRLAARVRIPVVELPRLTTGEVSLQELERLGRMAAGEAA